MRARRSIPPAAVPISLSDLYHGLQAVGGKTLGDRVEGEIRAYFRNRHLFFLSSGKAALFLILNALKMLKDRTRVILPAYTCYSVPSAVRKAGLSIVPCDVRPETLDFDHDQLGRLADEETLCILATHLFGIPSELGLVREIAEEKGIFVVEDAAQSFGVSSEGGRTGEAGDAAFFSFGRGKNITCGEGGVVVSGSEEIAVALRKSYEHVRTESARASTRSLLELALMKWFMNPYLYWLPDGLPFLKVGETRYYPDFPVRRMNGTRFGILCDWKRKLDRLNGIRIDASEEYKDRLKLDRGVKIYSRSIPYIRFPVYLKSEERKRELCTKYRFLGISPMYPAPVNTIAEIREIIEDHPVPSAARIAKTLVTLPTHGLADQDFRERICSVMEDAVDSAYQQ